MTTETFINWDDFEVGPNNIEPGDTFVWDETLWMRIEENEPDHDVCEFWAVNMATGDLAKFDECGEALIPVDLTITVERAS